MQLHHLDSINRKSKKRIGRGGKRGTFSGRGTKGQKSRAGRRIRPAIRDLIMRLPKRRGFSNRPTAPKPFSFNLSALARRIKPLLKGESSQILSDKTWEGELTVDKNLLKEIGIVPSDYRGAIKLLGDGEIDFAIIVKNIKISKSAKMKIEKAGGRVIANNANRNK